MTAARTFPEATQTGVYVVSEAKRAKRLRSRELFHNAMSAERAQVLDYAEAVNVNERTARRALKIDEHAAPIDIGDLLAMAETGPGGVRLALRALAELQAEINRIAASHR